MVTFRIITRTGGFFGNPWAYLLPANKADLRLQMLWDTRRYREEVEVLEEDKEICHLTHLYHILQQLSRLVTLVITHMLLKSSLQTVLHRFKPGKSLDSNARLT